MMAIRLLSYPHPIHRTTWLNRSTYGLTPKISLRLFWYSSMLSCLSTDTQCIPEPHEHCLIIVPSPFDAKKDELLNRMLFH